MACFPARVPQFEMTFHRKSENRVCDADLQHIRPLCVAFHLECSVCVKGVLPVCPLLIAGQQDRYKMTGSLCCHLLASNKSGQAHDQQNGLGPPRDCSLHFLLKEETLAD